MDKRNLFRTFSSLSGLGLALLFNNQGLAIGVGEVQVKSSLNQPLYASIPITSANGEESYQDSLRVKLASPEMHEQAGLRYPAELAQTHFDLYQAVNGRTQVLIGTTQPIHEPLVSFLLEVEWSHGRLLKEVSMLLDPPGYQRLPASNPAPPTMIAKQEPEVVQPVKLTAVADIGSIDVPVFVEVPAALKVAAADVNKLEYQRPQRRRTYTITDGQYGPVRSGDTLMEIAKAASRGTKASAKAKAREIFEANPESFNGSMNRMERGVILYIPSDDYQVAQATETTSREPSHQPSAGSDTSGFSTISDFLFDLPAVEITSTNVESDSKPEVPVVAPTSPSKSLEILPADKTSIQIAQDIAKKLEENETATESAELQPEKNNEIPSPNSSLKSAAGTISESAAADQPPKIATSTPDLSVKAEPKVETSEPVQITPPATNATEKLSLSIETNEMPHADAEDTHYVDILLKWLPWLLLMVALPIMLLFGLRRNKPEAPTKIPPPMPRGIDAQPPQRTHKEKLEQRQPKSPFHAPDETSEFNRDTAVLDRPIDLTTDSTPPTEIITHDDDLDHGYDLEPSASDTQETIRPAFDDESAPSTQILDKFDSVTNDAESELDAAQEAEIYLAYGQFSLAEAAINKLRDASGDNARYKLLQLKLFAETGKLEEMQVLAEDLLENSNAQGGLGQQIEKITHRAHTRHDSQEPLNKEQLNVDSDENPLIDEDPIDLKPDIVGQSFASSAQIEKPFIEDINDYLQEKPQFNELDSIGDDPLINSLGSMTAEINPTNPSLIEEESAFTDAELDAISMELDLMDDPGDSLGINNEQDQSYTDDAIENFSDTDYRLTPLGREDSKENKSERLDIPFDLESELEKLGQDDKPSN